MATFGRDSALPTHPLESDAHAAIDDQHVAVDVGSCVGREEDDGAAELVRLRPSADRRPLLDPGGELGVVHEGRVHFRREITGHDAVHRDALAAQLRCERARKPVEARLGGPGRVVLPELGLAAFWGGSAVSGKACVGIPAERPEGGLVLRTWRPGDRVVLPGRGPFKVKDALMEARIPAWRRTAALVVGDEEALFGILLPDRAWGAGRGERGCIWLERISS